VPDRVAPSANRIALVLPQSPRDGVAARGLSNGLINGEYLHDLRTQTAYIDPGAPQASAGTVAARIRQGSVGLVLALGHGPSAQALANAVRSLPETRFVFVDASLSELSLDGVPNAAAIRFAEEDSLLLAGYLSGLVSPLNESKGRVDQVSVVAAEPDRETERLLAGFKRGLRETSPGVTVRVDYSHELEDPTACERLANRQIDGGSDVVVAMSGRCGLGAAEVARTRGSWSIGAEEDGIRFRPHVLVATYKQWADASLFAIERLLQGTLPMGRDTVLGLEDDYAVGLEFGSNIPDRLESAVIEHCSRIRASRHRDL
jgi:basic membrane lipoprotein Med (substrate-binding protein (PBP1-ABC) superfamily)